MNLYARSVLLAQLENDATYRIFHFESFGTLQNVRRIRYQHFLGFDIIIW